jgi:hypothetical protein
MKTSGTWNFRTVVGKVMMVLALAAMIGSVDVLQASAKDKKWDRHDNGRHEWNRGRGYYENDAHGRRVYRSYGYRERIYVEPPPVIYAPPPPPGISVFFPPLIFR